MDALADMTQHTRIVDGARSPMDVVDGQPAVAAARLPDGIILIVLAIGREQQAAQREPADSGVLNVDTLQPAVDEPLLRRIRQIRVRPLAPGGRMRILTAYGGRHQNLTSLAELRAAVRSGAVRREQSCTFDAAGPTARSV